jgi:hypothetical protein
MSHEKVITQNQYLLIAIILSIIVLALDYIIIFEHPSIIPPALMEDNIDDIDDEEFEKLFEDGE